MKSFIAFLGLLSTMTLIMTPYWIILLGVAVDFPIVVKIILVVVGFILVRIVRPISVLSHNDKLKF